MSQIARRASSLDDFLAIPADERRHELLAGEIVERAVPSAEHGDAQAGVVGALRGPFHRSGGGGGGPGGWWILTEVEVLLDGGDVVRPDACGWRRDRLPARPTGAPVRARPDWIAEVVSASNASTDTVRKLSLYHRAGVPHYWLIDPRAASLTVLRWSAPGYVAVLAATSGDVVRAEPFEAIELEVGTLFGEDPHEGA